MLRPGIYSLKCSGMEQIIHCGSTLLLTEETFLDNLGGEVVRKQPLVFEGLAGDVQHFPISPVIAPHPTSSAS